MQVREEEAAFARLGARLVAVGFSPPEALAALADYLPWPDPFLSDESRSLYTRLGIGRGRVRDVYNASTLRYYREQQKAGREIRRPVDDPLQLGGDAVVVDGAALWVFRPPHPDARPTVEDLLSAVGAGRAG